MSAPTPEAEIDRLDLEILSVRLMPLSSEKFHALDRLENEKLRLQREIATGYRPPKGTATYSNQGYWKDFWTPWRSYPTDPTTNNGVKILRANQGFEDGYYAYAWRASDNLIAYVYSGKDKAFNNPVAHSYLASGGDVYAAGTFRVFKDEIVAADNASGHYKPDSKAAVVDDNCNVVTKTPASVAEFVKKLATMGYKKVSALAFKSPTIEFQQQDCFQQQRFKPLTFNAPRD